MKKLHKILLLLVRSISLTGCFKRDDMEGIDVYTTVYPIEYLVKELYGDSSNVLTIYPNGTNTFTYSLTNKQIKDYSNAS